MISKGSDSNLTQMQEMTTSHVFSGFEIAHEANAFEHISIETRCKCSGQEEVVIEKRLEISSFLERQIDGNKFQALH